jgi:hypothetical protein
MWALLSEVYHNTKIMFSDFSNGQKLKISSTVFKPNKATLEVEKELSWLT